MKTRKIFALALVIALFCLTACSSASGAADPEEKAKLLEMVGEYQSPSNNYQTHSKVWMGSENGKLYFYVINPISRRYQYDSTLCSIDAEGIHKIAVLRASDKEYVNNFNLSNGFLYFSSDTYDFSTPSSKLICYDFHNTINPFTILYRSYVSGQHSYPSNLDESIFFSLKDSNSHTSYLQVKGSRVISVSNSPETHILGNKTVIYDADYQHIGRVMVQDAQGLSKEIQMSYADERMIIPTEHGLLIHNYGPSDMLYYFDENGNLVNLFHADCYVSYSSVAVYNDRVFFSFDRYEKSGGGFLGMSGIRYENDSLIGTYVISLEDYSVRKLSDRIYSGLYIFDDSGIYACDNDCNVYKLSFDGEELGQILHYGL